VPKSSYDLIKEALFIKLKEGISREERVIVMNTVLSVIDEANFFFFDRQAFLEKWQQKVALMGVFNQVCCCLCFLLGTFQLIVTISANIRDSMWELGVLRSMGCTRGQITRVMVYEMVSNTIASLALGFFCGISVTLLTIAQFHLIVELPFKPQIDVLPFFGVCACAVVSMIMGAKYGTTILYSKNISKILKGM